MTLPRLYPILDTETLANCGVGPELVATAFLEGGARILQFRHKSHWSREVYATAQVVARLCQESGARFIVNDRADFALLLEGGLHIGQDDLSPHDARKLLGSKGIIGYSTHNLSQFSVAVEKPIDYVALGPVFMTASKRNPDPVLGVEQIRSCRPLLSKPLVAIGGITRENALEVLRAGADSIALISGLLPETPTAHSLRQRMEEWQQLVQAL
jgi:thiamine-phosphate pyrophosphorylase